MSTKDSVLNVLTEMWLTKYVNLYVTCISIDKQQAGRLSNSNLS